MAKGVWVVECSSKKEPRWSPVIAHIDRAVAEQDAKEWREAAPYDRWRVRRYTPDAGENQDGRSTEKPINGGARTESKVTNGNP